MAAQMVDRNAQRAGAALSAIVLLFGFLFDWHAVVPVVAVALGVGGIFGPRYSPLGGTYRALRSVLNLQIPPEPEEAAPPRFAQTLGFVFTAAGTVAFWPGGNTGLGWTLALIVAALQALLAGTGLCVGCEIYLFSRRLLAKGTA